MASKRERSLARAFRETMRKIASKVVLSEADDPDHVMRALSLDDAALRDILEKVRESYLAGGDSAAKKTAAGFGLQADDWLQKHGAELVERITRQQRDAIVEIITAGRTQGRTPRDIARDIAGHKTKGGQRRGGIVGLNESQAQYVANARAELRGDLSANNYFTRKRRDKTFDATIRRYLSEGKAVPKYVADRAVAQYADKMLITRSETIAQTETHNAYEAGQHEAWKQADEKGKTKRVVRVWRALNDSETREQHDSMDGQEVGLDEPFVDDDGNQYMYPGDSSMGAPPGMVINCRCSVSTYNKPLGVRSV